jgi:beta-propeller repeat-containing protein
VFVAKLDTSGSRLLYSTLLGGSAFDNVEKIAVDRAGNAYIAGETESKNFPTTAGAPQRVCGTCSPEKPGYSPDGFVAKLNRSGSRLLYATFLGGDSVDKPSGLAVDRLGSAYVAGSTFSQDFPTTRGAFDPTPNNPRGTSSGDAFVVKLNPAGTRLAYSTLLGGASPSTDLPGSSASGIAIDATGDAWVTGWSSSLVFPTTKGAFREHGHPGVFMTKLDRSGSRLVYSTFLGSAQPSRVALDPRGNVYVTGSVEADFPTTPGAYSTKSAGGFLMKFSVGG